MLHLNCISLWFEIAMFLRTYISKNTNQSKSHKACNFSPHVFYYNHPCLGHNSHFGKIGQNGL